MLLYFGADEVVGTATRPVRAGTIPSSSSHPSRSAKFASDPVGVAGGNGTVSVEGCSECTVGVAGGNGTVSVEGCSECTVAAAPGYTGLSSNVPRISASPSVGPIPVGCCSTDTRSCGVRVWWCAVLFLPTATLPVFVEHRGAARQGQCLECPSVWRAVVPTRHCRPSSVVLPPHIAAQNV
jgi:hypothetical protein